MARPKGIPQSKEQKEIMRKKMSGKNNPFYGKKHSIESKRKMSISQKKRPPLSIETKRKIKENNAKYWKW